MQAGWEVVEGGPKTEGGGREVSLVDAGRRHAEGVEARSRRPSGSSGARLGRHRAWCSPTEDGRGHGIPDAVTDTFERLAFAAHLPPVRLHDVRHAHISELFAAGVDVRIISERVGHSGSKMTRDYAAVAAEVSRAAAEKVVGMIPRRSGQ